MLKSSENTYTSTFICRLFADKEARPKRKHRKRYKEERPGRSFSEKQVFQFCLLSFWDLLGIIPLVF